ncbi:MAG: ABC transporter substrate-binding protein [Lachnospiraceae bacterium]|nr:ABC transporter substrate-binding protein [Lachnospiraceae bacterium]
MKKRYLALLMSTLLTATMLVGCGSKTTEEAPSTQQETVAEVENTSTEDTAEATQSETEEQGSESAVETTGETVRVGSLKGATSIGLLKLMDGAKNENTKNQYEFTMATAADELLPKMVSGDLDIALVPANVASVLYNKTKGGIEVIDINTLGVLYMVSGDTSMSTIGDLKGKTIYLTGKGTTPDYVLHYILSENGLTETDVTLEYKSEATEVAAVLAEDTNAVGLLPQPFVTAACTQNEALQVIFDMTKEWKNIQGESGSALVTGVTVVRKAFAEEAPEAVKAFMEEHKASAAYVGEDVDQVAAWTEEQGIIAKEAIAKKAIPNCNITYIDGAQMQQALSGYLQVLFDQDPASVGGKMPADDFYFDPSTTK